MRYTFKFGDELEVIAPRSMADELVLNVGGRDCSVTFDHFRDGQCSLLLDGKSYPSWVARDGDDIYIKLGGDYHKVTAVDPRAAAAGTEAEGSVSAPMPGVVVEVIAKEGDVVEEGAKLLTIESMKLQSSIMAPCSGTVSKITVAAGDEFNKDDVLVEIDDENV